MKKYFFRFLFCLLPLGVQAQDMISKRGDPVVPEKGDWGVMFDVVPFLKHTGNIFNQSSYPTFLNEYENTLVLKKFKEENRALRLKMRLGIAKETVDTIVVGLSSTSPEPSVTDSRETSAQNITVGVGFQKSKGKGRLKSYRGMELLIKYFSKRTAYSYGDGALTALVWMHTNTFGQGAGVTEVKEGTLGLNLRYILGVEYFFAPKMSLSAEYSWGINYFVIGEVTEVSEQWNFSTNKVKTTTKRIPKRPTFELDNLYDAASINLGFYF